jgi:hypothetical protein
LWPVWRLALDLLGVHVFRLSDGNRKKEERGMATNGTGKGRSKGAAATAEAPASRTPNPDITSHRSATRSGELASAGVQTGEDFANLMSALMSDVIDGSISPNIANAAVNAGGKLLKVVEMQYRYGSSKEQRETVLVLAPGR